jgi:hypothetical protein
MKIIRTLQVHLDDKNMFTEDSHLSYFMTDMADYGYVKIGEVQIEIDVDPKEINLATIRMLRVELQKVKERAFEKQTGIEGKIQNLLCLEG